MHCKHLNQYLNSQSRSMLKFIYSEKATKFCKNVVSVKSKMEILANFVAFSEYMNFNIIEKSEIHCRMVPIIFFYALSLKYTFFYKGLAKSFSFLSKLKKEDFFGPLRIYVLYPVFFTFLMMMKRVFFCD